MWDCLRCINYLYRFHATSPLFLKGKKTKTRGGTCTACYSARRKCSLGVCVWGGAHPYDTAFSLNSLPPDFLTVLDSAWKRKWRPTPPSVAPPSHHTSGWCYGSALYTGALEKLGAVMNWRAGKLTHGGQRTRVQPGSCEGTQVKMQSLSPGGGGARL